MKDMDNIYIDEIRRLETALGEKKSNEKILRDLLFNAFIKTCLDAGNYNLSALKVKDKEVMSDAFQYWIDTIRDYGIETVEFTPKEPTT